MSLWARGLVAMTVPLQGIDRRFESCRAHSFYNLFASPNPMVQGVFLGGGYQEELAQLPWESYIDKAQALHILETGGSISNFSWDYTLAVANPIGAASVEAAIATLYTSVCDRVADAEILSDEKKIMSRLQGLPRFSKEKILVTFLSAQSPKQLLDAGIVGASLFAHDLPIGVNLRKSVGWIEFFAEGSHLYKKGFAGKYTLKDPSFYFSDRELCAVDREEILFDLGRLVHDTCIAKELENEYRHECTPIWQRVSPR